MARLADSIVDWGFRAPANGATRGPPNTQSSITQSNRLMAHWVAPEAESDLDELWYYVASNGSVEIADRLVDSLTTRFFLLGKPTRRASPTRSSSRRTFISGG